MNHKGHRGRGSVGRAFSNQKRYKIDKEFRARIRERRRAHRHKNKEKIRIRAKVWSDTLSEFVNRKCKVCNKLLNFKTKTLYCKEHYSKLSFKEKAILKKKRIKNGE